MRKSKILAAMLALAVTTTSVLSVPSLLSAATDNSIRMEAETDGDFNNYADLEGNVVGGSSNSPYTMADIKENGLDKSVTSYVEYTVEAPESGEYDVTVGGIMGAGADISNYHTVIVVNNGKGDDVYEAVYHYDVPTGRTQGTVAVTLKLNEGVNTIACTGIVNDTLVTQDCGWGAYLNQDYLDIDSRLTPVSANRMWAYQDAVPHYYVVSGTKLENGNDPTQTFAEIEQNGLSAGTSYAEYTVEAPEGGEYTVSLGAVIGAGSKISAYQTAVIVNEGGAGNTYQAVYSFDTPLDYTKAECRLNIRLKAGKNTVKCTTVTKDTLNDNPGAGWAYCNQNYLAVYSLKAVKPGCVTVSANNPDFIINKYNREASQLGGGDYSAIHEVSVENLTEGDNLANTPYVQIMVKAPADGTYNVRMRYQTPPTNRNLQVFACVKSDGTVTTSVRSKDKWVGYTDFVIDLTEGNNTLIFTMPLPKDAESLAGFNWGDAWANLFDFDFYGLTVPAIQKDITFNRIEAEDAEYAYLNAYSSTPEEGGTGFTVGGSADIRAVQSFNEIAANGLSDETSYVEYMVEVPEDGDYYLTVGVRLGAYTAFRTYQGAVAVNGGGPGNTYRANYTFDSALAFANEATATVCVSLKQGVNRIACTGALKDMVDAGAAWAYMNQDYLDVENTLTPIPYKKMKRMEAENDAYLNLYGKLEEGGTGFAVGGSVDIKNTQTLDDIVTNGLNPILTSYAEYTVEAPADGEYTVNVGVRLGASTAMSRYIAALVVNDGKGDDVYPCTYSFSTPSIFTNIKVYSVTVRLKKGTNTIACTSVLKDMLQEGAEWAYINQDYLDLDVRLTPVAYEKPARYESELYALPNQIVAYTNRTGYSGNGYLGDANTGSVQSLADIRANGIKAMNTPFADYQITAEADGTYSVYIAARYAAWLSGVDEVPVDKAFMVVECGDYRTVLETPVFGTSVQNRVFLVKVPFKEGGNLLRVSGFTADSKFDGGEIWCDFDYIELPKELTVEPLGGVLEAETAEKLNFFLKYSDNMSGGKYLGSADYTSLGESGVTFDTLSEASLDDIPWVRFTMEAKTAGAYSVALRFQAGTSDEVLPEEAWLAVVTNDNFAGRKKLSFVPSEFAIYCLAFTVDLVEGENTILITNPLCEFRPIADGRIDLWADMDCLYLGGGLSLGNSDVVVGGGDNVDDEQLKVGPMSIMEPESSGGKLNGLPGTGTDFGGEFPVMVSLCVVSAMAVLTFKLRSRRKNK